MSVTQLFWHYTVDPLVRFQCRALTRGKCTLHCVYILPGSIVLQRVRQEDVAFEGGGEGLRPRPEGDVVDHLLEDEVGPDVEHRHLHMHHARLQSSQWQADVDDYWRREGMPDDWSHAQVANMYRIGSRNTSKTSSESTARS